MRSGYSIGLDVGTSSAKAVVFSPDTGIVGRGSGSYPTDTPRAGWAEQNPEDWWRGSLTAMAAALADADVGEHDVAATAVSGQGGALVLLDSDLKPVRPSLIHLDQRASAQAEKLADSPVGTAIQAANGQVVGSWNVAAKLSWMRANDPSSLERLAGITSAAGFVLSQLTGRLVQSASDAGISDLIDLTTRDWSDAVLEALELDRAVLPAVLPATAEIGPATGFAPSVLVVAGGEDTASAALSAGVVARDDTYLSLGSAGVVGVAVARGSVREPRLLTFPHIRDDIDLLSGSMTSAGAAIEWFAGISGVSASVLLEEAASSKPGAGGVVFLPYLAGELHPINDPHARGVFAGLSLATSRADLTRAIVEGSATAIADNLQVAIAAGAQPGTLVATGGPTRSPVWMQSVADSTGRSVEVVDAQGAPLGDAILAAAENDDEAAGLAMRHKRTTAHYEPQATEAATARRIRARETYHALRDLGEDAV